jgi:hypothetical protein
MAPRSQLAEQLGFDEQTIEDLACERALENRLLKKGSLDAVQKVYDEADEAAKLEIAKLELPEGGAVRVGRFRITRTATAGRAVSFETKPSSRIRIVVIGEDDA